MFRALIERASATLPSQCMVCHAWPARPLCDACIARFARPRARCISCALPLPDNVTRCGACIRHPPPLDRCFAAVSYEYPWNELVARYKFGASPGWSSELALLLRTAGGAPLAVDEAELVLPMPISNLRLRERGFNQALELARALAPGKTRHDVLLRLRDTPPQSSLPRAQRLRNVKDAFGVAPGKESLVAHRHVLLIDDVMTSGASLSAAALALRSAGAAHVTGLVLARTE